MTPNAASWLDIDGSQGEGGGQIVRTAVTLACVTGRPIRIRRIRAGRARPGLAAQHLTAVRAAQTLCSAQCSGLEKGSQQVEFQPGPIRSGDYIFDIGTPGATTLVLQTVLPPLFLADRPSTVTVTGGTHNPLAPPFDFLARSFVPRLADMGWHACMDMPRPGFYPAGGGCLQARVTPVQREALGTLDLIERGPIRRIDAEVHTARLPERIAADQERLLHESGIPFDRVHSVEVRNSAGPGNCVLAEIEAGNHITVLAAFGQRGKPSKAVIGELASVVIPFLESGAAVDRFLADQLLLYMALAGGGVFTTDQVTSHARTNMEVIGRFLPVEFDIVPRDGRWLIRCRPRQQVAPGL